MSAHFQPENRHLRKISGTGPACNAIKVVQHQICVYYKFIEQSNDFLIFAKLLNIFKEITSLINVSDSTVFSFYSAF